MDVSRPARMLVSALATSRPAMAGLSSAGRRCQELVCGPHEFCSTHLLRCRPCEEICTPSERNYQQNTCDEQCQDYLHDLTYLRKSDQQESMAALARMEADLERLTILVGVMFCLLVVCFVWLAFHACSSRRHRCRKRKTADIEADSFQLKNVGDGTANGTAAVAGPPVITQKANTVPQYTLGRHNSSFLMATKHGDELKGARGRHPSEDTCPGEYSAAYDNPALTVTPPADAGGATGHPLAAAAAPESPPPLPRSRDPARSSSRRRPDVPRSQRPRDSRPASRAGSVRAAPDADITDMEPGRLAAGI